MHFSMDKINEGQVFNLALSGDDVEIKPKSQRNIGIANVTDVVIDSAHQIAETAFKKTALEQDSFKILVHNLTYLKNKADIHNAKWSVYLANLVGLTNFKYFSDYRMCKTAELSDFIDGLKLQEDDPKKVIFCRLLSDMAENVKRNDKIVWFRETLAMNTLNKFKASFDEVFLDDNLEFSFDMISSHEMVKILQQTIRDMNPTSAQSFNQIFMELKRGDEENEQDWKRRVCNFFAQEINDEHLKEDNNLDKKFFIEYYKLAKKIFTEQFIPASTENASADAMLAAFAVIDSMIILIGMQDIKNIKTKQAELCAIIRPFLIDDQLEIERAG